MRGRSAGSFWRGAFFGRLGGGEVPIQECSEWDVDDAGGVSVVFFEWWWLLEEGKVKGGYHRTPLALPPLIRHVRDIGRLAAYAYHLIEACCLPKEFPILAKLSRTRKQPPQAFFDLYCQVR